MSRFPGSGSRVMCLMAPWGLCGFWAGLYLASARFPSEYDWRYMTVSSLLYPERNPLGFVWAWSGLGACALGGLCWVSALSLSSEWRDRTRRPGIVALALGFISMVACALWPGRMLHFPRGHDLLALIAFVSLCFGTVHLAYERSSAHLRVRHSAPAATVAAALVASGALLPLIFEGLSQADVARAFPHLPWVGIEWRARGVPVYLSFAFWEWTTCAVFTVYIAALAVTTSIKH